MENLTDMTKTSKMGYFVDETQKKRQGHIDLSTIERIEKVVFPVGKVEEESGKCWGFILHTHKNGRKWVLKAASHEIREEWCARLSMIAGLLHEPIAPDTITWQKSQASKNWKEALAKRQRIYVDAKVPCWKREEDELTGSPYTVFVVQVKTNAAYLFEQQTDFSVAHRYSDFLKLSQDLLVYLKPAGVPVPYIPPRGYTNRFSGAILEERRQSFEALLEFWLNLFGDVNRIALPLLDFLKPRSGFDVPCPYIPAKYELGNIVDCNMVKLPPILRFQPGVGFPERLHALNLWLSTREPEELYAQVSCFFATKVIETIGGLSVNHRMEVAKMLVSCVNDPHRMFLILEMFPDEDIPEVVEHLKKQLQQK
jgi:hypothetical protein